MRVLGVQHQRTASLTASVPRAAQASTSAGLKCLRTQKNLSPMYPDDWDHTLFMSWFMWLVIYGCASQFVSLTCMTRGALWVHTGVVYKNRYYSIYKVKGMSGLPPRATVQGQQEG